jgi:hypothetical protein
VSVPCRRNRSRSRETYRPKLSGLLTDGASDGRALHLTLGVDNLRTTNQYPVRFPICSSSEFTHHTGVVLEVEEDAVGSPPRLALADDDSRHDLLPELRLSLLDGGHDHVTDTSGGQTVKTCADALNGDDVEVTGAGVVAAVHDCAAVRTPLSDISNLQSPFRI